MHFLVKLILAHFNQLCIDLNVIRGRSQRNALKANSNNTNTTINVHFLVATFAYSILFICSFFLVHLIEGHPLTLASLRTSPYIFSHLPYFQVVWPQIDVIFTAFAINHLWMLLCFITNGYIPHRWLFYLKTERIVELNGIELSRTESTNIIQLYRQSKWIFLALFGLFYSVIMVYFHAMLLVKKAYSFISILSILYWIALMPFFLYYLLFFFIGALMFVIISTSCLAIRQKYVLGKLVHLQKQTTTTKRPSHRYQSYLVCQYFTHNDTIRRICHQQEAFSHFWTAYLTLSFAMYLFYQCYVANVALYSRKPLPFFVKAVYLGAVTETILLIFGLIQYCAVVVKYNYQFTATNRQVLIGLMMTAPSRTIKLLQLLKMDLLQWDSLLTFYGIKLFGGYRITSSTFHAMFINVTMFFLFVQKNKL